MRKTKTGKRRPHPPGCGHCQMVQDYRDERERQIAEWENGGFRNGTRSIITFKEWLIMLGRENRGRRMREQEYAA